MKISKEVQEELIQIEREACTDSFYEFFLSFWDTVVQEELQLNWHIKLICDELQYLAPFLKERRKKPYDLVFNVPPGSTKTTLILQMFPAWLWVVDPTLRIISSSHSSPLSIESASKTRDIINSPRFKLLFPGIVLRADKYAKTAFENTQNGTRDVTSTGSSITGRHAHIKLMDDLQEISKAASKPDREQAVNHMKTLFTREVEKGNSINVLIMQRLHELDCTAYLLGLTSKRKVRHICLPAEESDKINPPELRQYYVNGLLDPIRMSASVLADKKIELGTYGYQSQFQQEPTPPEGGIIKRKWFGKIQREQFLQEKSVFHFWIDTAYEKKKEIRKDGEAKNDPTGLLTCIEQRGKVYLWDYREVYMELPDLVKFIPRYVRANGYSNRSQIRIEPKASGKSTIQTIVRETNLNVMEESAYKDSKETELTNAAPTIEAGRFILIEGVWNELFLNRICGFPNSAHDEAVDLLCYAKRFYLGQIGQNKQADEAYQKALKYLT